jgi:pyruvate/2-oxoglutarate dehydrogenase complex dihydrolipoamide acyltransferase (E2) component
VDGRVEARNLLHLSLTFGHRVCDGGTAAGFLHHVFDRMTNLRNRIPVVGGCLAR